MEIKVPKRAPFFIQIDLFKLGLGLPLADLTALKMKYPQKSFVYIFQTSKEGNCNGANSFQQDVDVVIEILERGKAVQFGRFNQGGEMNIF